MPPSAFVNDHASRVPGTDGESASLSSLAG